MQTISSPGLKMPGAPCKLDFLEVKAFFANHLQATKRVVANALLSYPAIHQRSRSVMEALRKTWQNLRCFEKRS